MAVVEREDALEFNRGQSIRLKVAGTRLRLVTAPRRH